MSLIFFSHLQPLSTTSTYSHTDTNCNPEQARVPLSPSDQLDVDSYFLAVSFFEGKEYARCVRALTGCKGPKAMFLKLYARYVYIFSYLLQKARVCVRQDNDFL